MALMMSSKKITPTLMPPQNFRITRRVGSDSLLVAWTPPNDHEVTGYVVISVLIALLKKPDLGRYNIISLYHFFEDSDIIIWACATFYMIIISFDKKTEFIGKNLARFLEFF
jgi:hypothetical protein